MTGGQELCGLGTSPMICFDSDDLAPTYRLMFGLEPDTTLIRLELNHGCQENGISVKDAFWQPNLQRFDETRLKSLQ